MHRRRRPVRRPVRSAVAAAGATTRRWASTRPTNAFWFTGEFYRRPARTSGHAHLRLQVRRMRPPDVQARVGIGLRVKSAAQRRVRTSWNLLARHGRRLQRIGGPCRIGSAGRHHAGVLGQPNCAVARRQHAGLTGGHGAATGEYRSTSPAPVAARQRRRRTRTRHFDDRRDRADADRAGPPRPA